MNKENSKKLFDKFKFFHPETSITVSLMAFGFECKDGWFKLIWDLCEGIEKSLESNDVEEFRVLQVKEKFGTLRFYTNWETEEIGKLIEEAEKKSAETCELCGEPGELTSSGYWMYTICESCEEIKTRRLSPSENGDNATDANTIV